MKHVHWIGTGLSSIPGIRRLAKNLDNFTVWNRTLDKAIKSIDHVDKNNVNAKQFEVDLLFNETNPGDIVISQLPANKHLEIAKLCLKHKCHFASTSYLNPEINILNSDVKKENLVFINEVGLDPGIDHFFSHLHFYLSAYAKKIMLLLKILQRHQLQAVSKYFQKYFLLRFFHWPHSLKQHLLLNINS